VGAASQDVVHISDNAKKVRNTYSPPIPHSLIMPTTAHGFHQSTIHKAIKLLIHNLVYLNDTTGEFLLKLEDGRVIDTKGWGENNWEWTHGIGLYGIWQYHILTNDPESLQIIEDWLHERFAAGGTTKNINTMAVFLTLACLYEKTKNQTYLPWLDAWGEWAMYDLERTEYGGMQHITYVPLPSPPLPVAPASADRGVDISPRTHSSFGTTH
jgi:unsaturated rhamnogalacturonyl hydrolase